MTLNYDKMTMLRISKYYYLDGMSQQDISAKENIHRSQISRILKIARELGYVQITISVPDSVSADLLGKKLEGTLGLKQVLIAPTLSSQADQSESLCFFAARYLEKVLPHSKNIGIGLGKTLYDIASQLTFQQSDPSPDFFSVVGSSGTDNSYLQNSVLLDNFARHFSGKCHHNIFPVFVRRDAMSPLDLSRYNELQKAYRTLDAVVLSVGGAVDIANPYYEEFAQAAKDVPLDFTRPHGDLLGHVFFDNHEVFSFPDDYLVTSMSPEMLEKVPSVICIASGSQKIRSIISAARQKYISVLITDEVTAGNILREIGDSGGSQIS